MQAWAVEALHLYCEGMKGDDWRYSGSWFDRLADQSTPNAFTANDIVAVSMLSVRVPALAAIRILKTDRDELSRSLVAIGADRPIWEANSDALEDGSHADKLWRRLTGMTGVGPVIAGKLMAAKRPNLVPVYDEHVHAALGAPQGRFWLALRQSMLESHEAVARVLHEAGVNVTVLRAADIVVWMHQHGWINAQDALEPPPTLT